MSLAQRPLTHSPPRCSTACSGSGAPRLWLTVPLLSALVCRCRCIGGLPQISRWLPVLVIALLALSMIFDRFKDIARIVFGFGLVFAFYLIGTNRPLRALYVPLFFIGFGALAGVVAAGVLTQGLQQCFAPLIDAGNTGAIKQISDSGLVILLIGFVALGIWSANRLIAGLARLYERGWISDISLVFLFGMALTAALA